MKEWKPSNCGRSFTMMNSVRGSGSGPRIEPLWRWSRINRRQPSNRAFLAHDTQWRERKVREFAKKKSVKHWRWLSHFLRTIKGFMVDDRNLHNRPSMSLRGYFHASGEVGCFRFLILNIKVGEVITFFSRQIVKLSSTSSIDRFDSLSLLQLWRSGSVSNRFRFFSSYRKKITRDRFFALFLYNQAADLLFHGFS